MSTGALRSRKKFLTVEPEVRKQLLEQGAVATGQRWAERWRADLRHEGRPAAGGWPGTMPEARAHVTAFFFSELTRLRLVALSTEELEWTSRAAYASAKHEWLSRVEREEPDPPH